MPPFPPGSDAGSDGEAGAAVDGAGSSAFFNVPTGLALLPGGDVLVADTFNGLLRRISPSRVVSTFAVTGTPPTFTPYALAYDARSRGGSVTYVGEACRISALDGAGAVLRVVAGAGPNGCGAVDGPGGAAGVARVGIVSSLLVNASDFLIFVDQTANAVRAVSPGGVVSTLAGSLANAAATPYPPAGFPDGASSPTSRGAADGAGAAAAFSLPTGIALSRTGDYIIADTLNHLIRRVTPAGVVSTNCGQRDAGGDCTDARGHRRGRGQRQR